MRFRVLYALMSLIKLGQRYMVGVYTTLHNRKKMYVIDKKLLSYYYKNYFNQTKKVVTFLILFAPIVKILFYFIISLIFRFIIARRNAYNRFIDK
jgi:hypothetical protein